MGPSSTEREGKGRKGRRREIPSRVVKVKRWQPYKRLTFDKYVTSVAKSYNYHAQIIRHIRHLLTLELAQTLACNLIFSRIDYCNALLHGAPTCTIQKLQREQNNAARIQAPRRSDVKPLFRRLHWLLVEQRITYKLAVVTYKVRCTETPAYLSRHLQTRDCAQNLRSSSAGSAFHKN